ncbi:DUF3592 domain-containing protein [Pseudonocardia asaccharolytica]|uniref:DUF3592 domain-containing protein n=1 Tax=Pseudonocardia asaccharolytica DSM 44247 = NBRC 16224 TaxID=1123024 RepID=A0A511CVU2_9PSEU|nr:DUF3592 domain-containing protein [Pseudonocardia asaccharolytica]GEL16363.1 hypothetical protein PA7_02000 [Pseudonocardia asaccharolytica DSM 44247 = NBRC 16224]
MTSSANELIDEVAGSARTALRILRYRLPELVVGLAVLIAVLAGLALVGSALDDRSIDARRVVTTAEVLEGSSFSRTLVRFSLPNGQAVVPERGVLHPRGVSVGETILVEYDAAEPELVRVAGRGTVDGLGTAGAGVLGVWAVLGPVAFWLRRRRTEQERLAQRDGVGAGSAG